MQEPTTNYKRYLFGCRTLGIEPLSQEDFVVRWELYSAHAEKLFAAEESGEISGLSPELRQSLQRSVHEDLFVKAVLIGHTEDAID